MANKINRNSNLNLVTILKTDISAAKDIVVYCDAFSSGLRLPFLPRQVTE
jgi:hypothetical protein